MHVDLVVVAERDEALAGGVLGTVVHSDLVPAGA